MSQWPPGSPGPHGSGGPDIPPAYGPPPGYTPRGGGALGVWIIISAVMLLLLGTCIGGMFAAVGVVPEKLLREAWQGQIPHDVINDTIKARPKLLAGGLLTVAVGLVGGVALLALLPGVRRGDRGRMRLASRIALGLGGLLLGLAVGGAIATPVALTGVCCSVVGAVLLLATGVMAEVARRKRPVAVAAAHSAHSAPSARHAGPTDRDDPWNAF